MNICNNKMTYQIVRDIRNEAFAKLEILPLKYLDGHPSGEVVSRIIADVDQFADGLLMGFTQLFTGVLTIVGTIGFMLSVNVGITLVVLLITPVSTDRGLLYCKENIYHVPTAVGGERGTDGTDR